MEKDQKKPGEKVDESKPAGQEKKDEAAPKKPAYVFKIVPADPKNAFDFEDVADK
jgi:hypothetical protein